MEFLAAFLASVFSDLAENQL